jgi:hypothetical protein
MQERYFVTLKDGSKVRQDGHGELKRTDTGK